MSTFTRRFGKRFNVLLSLFSLVLVVTIAACSGPEAATDSAATGGMPAEFRNGYLVIPNAEE